MARYGCTITVATGKVPSAQTDFTWVAVTANFPSAAIDGGSTSINNGGGNLKCYTDSGKGTRLPVEVVTFVTGGSPSILIWGLSSSLNVGSTVYIEADTVATSLPANGAAFGRDAVWADHLAALHLYGGSLTDSSGNGYNGTLGGTSPTSLSGQGYSFSNGYISLGAVPLNGRSTVSVHCTFKNAAASADKGIWYLNNDEGAGDEPFGLRQDSTVSGSSETVTFQSAFSQAVGGYRIGHQTNSSTTSVQRSCNVFDNQAATVYMDGANDLGTLLSSDTSTTLNVGTGDLRIGTGAKDRYTGEIYSFYVKETADSADFCASRDNNQSDPSTFWSTGAWEDQDTGLTISPPSIASTEAFGTAEITTGSVTLSPSGIASLEAFGTAEVTTGVEIVSPSSIASEESVPTPEITTGVVTLSPSGITSQESVPSPTVESLGVILTPLSIASLEAFGNAVVERLLAILSPLGITSAESFGLVTVVGGDTLIIPVDERQTWNRVAKYLRTVGFKGSDNDVIVAWLRSEGLLEGAYNDMWNEYLLNNGYFALTLTDKYAAWRQNVITAAFNSSGVLTCGGTIQCSEIIPCGE